MEDDLPESLSLLNLPGVRYPADAWAVLLALK
jgi:hypothetical protein